MSRKWRPSLLIVLGGALGGTLALSFLGLIALRYIGPQIGFREGAAIVALCIGTLTGALGLLLLRLLLRPLSALDGYAHTMRRNPGTTLPPPQRFGTREIHSVADSVIEMAATLHNRETTVRNYTNHVTHELKTPVSALRAASELLSDSPSLTAEDRSLMEQIARATDQLEGQLSALRDVAKAQEADHHGTARLSAALPEIEGLRVKIHHDPILPLSEHGAGIVLGHLLRNAYEHGATEVTISQGTELGVVVIADNGQGVSEGNRDRIFDPFFTTRRETGGTGMGLWIALSLLRNQGGHITLEPSGTGTAFSLRFPNLNTHIP